MLFRLVNLKLFNMKRKYYLLFIFAFILSCEKDDDHDYDSEVLGCMDETATNYNDLANVDDGSCVYGDDFSKSSMLINWYDNIIIPAHNEFYTKLNELKIAVDFFISSPNINTLQNTTDAWLLSYKYWQHIEMFDIGIAEVINFKNKMNVYPTDVDLINLNISNGTYDLNNNNNFDARGFPAIDYMLHGLEEDPENIVNTFISNPSFQTYLVDLIDNMIYNTELVLNDWINNKQSFVSSTENTATSSINKIANDFIYFFEKGLRANKIGIPAGRYSSDPLPNTVEAYYKQDVSKELASEALRAAKNFFVGNHFEFNKSNSSGFSFNDYLIDLNNNNLVSLIISQFDDAESKINQLDDNFINQIQMNNTQMLYAFDALQQLVVSFKVDMLQALGISVDYIDADGD